MLEKETLLSFDEFYRLFESDADLVASYCVGFVLISVRNNEEYACLGGSGTLVTIAGRNGILTAEHVIRLVLSHPGEVGLILAKHGRSQVHRVVIKPRSEACTVFRNDNDSESGPDLGFMELDPDVVGTVSAKKTFHNLSKHRDRMLSSPAKSYMGAWYISGMPSEWTKDASRPAPFRKIMEFRGIVGEVQHRESHQSDGFDYHVFDAFAGGDPSLWPTDYEGFSGSGVWQILIKETEGKMEIADRLLSAVAFYQSDPSDKKGQKIRAITCHGRLSIYSRLIDAVTND